MGDACDPLGEYDIVFDLAGTGYDNWLPTDGGTFSVTARVKAGQHYL
jgi:hypothetical protein